MSKEKRLESAIQKNLFRIRANTGKGSASPIPDFKSTKDSELYFPETTIVEYLKGNGLEWIIALKRYFFSLEMTELFRNYSYRGNRAIHPALMLSLITYCVMQGRRSLREIENEARLNIAAMYLCGGFQPHFTTIGDFLVRHKNVLTEGFFNKNVEKIFKGLNIASSCIAIDGSTFEAAASRFGLVMKEALLEEAKGLREESETYPGNKELAKKAERAENALDEASRRIEQTGREEAEKEKVKINKKEPTAALLPMKNGRGYRMGYKVVISATKERLVTGIGINPTSETAVVEEVITQHETGVGTKPQTAMMDAGFFSIGIFEMACRRDLNVLIAEGSAVTNAYDNSKINNGFDKRHFIFREEIQEYICPAGKRLKRRGSGSAHGHKYNVYRCDECKGCEYFGRCTTSNRGRIVKRFEGEEYKECMREVMRQEKAKEMYKQRKVIVEPVFSVWRGGCKFNRFLRRGLQSVKMEAILVALSCNLKIALKRLGLSAYLLNSRQSPFYVILFIENPFNSIFIFAFPPSHPLAR